MYDSDLHLVLQLPIAFSCVPTHAHICTCTCIHEQGTINLIVGVGVAPILEKTWGTRHFGYFILCVSASVYITVLVCLFAALCIYCARIVLRVSYI